MKATATIAILVASSASLLAEDPVSPPLQSVPKNLARQHYGANLFVFDASTQRYVATEAAAAWLDDDVSTGWPAIAGKQNYLLQLGQTQLLTSFALSTRPTEGTVTLYTSDQPAAPGDASWTPVAKDVPIADINHKKLANPLNKTAKFVLIETNIAEPGPIYSLYLYGNKAAATEAVVKRAEPADIRQVAGEFVNNQTSFNLTSIYAKSLVTHANAGEGAGAWQRAIDDNAESAIAIRPSTAEAGLVATVDGTHAVSRMSILADPAAKGTVDVFLLPDAPQGSQPVSLDGLTPAASLALDGASGRASADIDDVPTGAVAIRWTPEVAGTPLAVRELNTFGDLSLAEYEVGGLPTTNTVAQVAGDEAPATSDGKTLMPVGSGPETADFKGGSGKEALPPVAAGPGTGFRPGGLGFPPRVLSPLTPTNIQNPVSP